MLLFSYGNTLNFVELSITISFAKTVVGYCKLDIDIFSQDFVPRKVRRKNNSIARIIQYVARFPCSI